MKLTRSVMGCVRKLTRAVFSAACSGSRRAILVQPMSISFLMVKLLLDASEF